MSLKNLSWCNLSPLPFACYLGPILTLCNFHSSFPFKPPFHQFFKLLLINFSRPFTNCFALLWTCSRTSVSFLWWRDPNLNSLFKVRVHQCWVEGHKHFPTPAATLFPIQARIVLLSRFGAALFISLCTNAQPRRFKFCY